MIESKGEATKLIKSGMIDDNPRLKRFSMEMKIEAKMMGKKTTTTTTKETNLLPVIEKPAGEQNIFLCIYLENKRPQEAFAMLNHMSSV